MDLRIGWRTLIQEPAYTLASILSLSIGLAASLLLFGFVRYSFSYDAHLPQVDQLYVVTQHYNVDPRRPKYEVGPLFLRTVAINTSGVTGATSYLPLRPELRPLIARVDGRLLTLSGLAVLPGFDTMLGLQALQGNVRAALEHPDSLVVTESGARRLFGSADVLGRALQADGKTVRVGAVVRTPPGNSTISFEMLAGVNSALVEPMIRSEMLTGEQGWMGKLLIRVAPGASLPTIRQALQQAVDRTPSLQHYPPETRALLGERRAIDIGLSPLRDAYFDDAVENSRVALAGPRASRTVVVALGTVALAILALAAINYINLATVRVLRRQREIAMRKVLGADAGRVAGQFLAESLLVALAATALGLMLAWLALPVFAQLVNRELEGLLTPSNIAAALALGASLGAVTALSPIWIALHVHPGQVLAGRPDTESLLAMRWRRALTALQAAVAMCLTGFTIAIAWQTEYAMRASPGFDPAPLLVVGLPEPVKFSDRARGLMTALAARPGVAGVAISEDPVGKLDMAWSRELKRPGGAAAAMDMKSVSAAFFALYRIKPLAGRLFDPRIDREDDAEPVILNAIAARALGFATPQAALGETVLFTGYDDKVIRKRVIGIAPDLRFRTLRAAPVATAYELWTAGVTLSIRVNGDPAPVADAVRKLWPRYFPDHILKLERADAILAANYADDARMVRLLAAASLVAMLIAAFGTYSLSANTVQRRAREIILRKLHGARRTDIGLLILRETGILTLTAAAIGLPIAALLIDRYFASFVEHAPVGYWTLLLALGLSLFSGLVAATRHALIAMRLMPEAVLRV
ncbi:FtsX-like permease family protein [Duganella callida]|uniref:FtsX-like permease family protein n=1 Tax=Duganella callida TaxID=2561932 RepID=A0A4Y9SXW1_9BURK|nr:FtsX-like permease family protein [Duganella callida]TFW29473.1 FtsX-like permease family protein [Duganella callida]